MTTGPLRAEASPHSVLITCDLCPSWRIVRADRPTAWAEARTHAAIHGRAAVKQTYNARRPSRSTR